MEDIGRLKAYCKDPEYKELLWHAIVSSAPGIEKYVYGSLTTGKGYDALSKKEYIPTTKADFYAYQRKAMAGFYRLLKILGIWQEK